MPWDRKRLLGYVETIQLILGVTDKVVLDDIDLFKREVSKINYSWP